MILCSPSLGTEESDRIKRSDSKSFHSSISGSSRAIGLHG